MHRFTAVMHQNYAVQPTLDDILSFLPNLKPEGDVLGIEFAMQAGRLPALINPIPWPIPEEVSQFLGDGPERIGIVDEVLPINAGVVLLRPPTLVLGLHAESDADPHLVEDLVIETLAAANLARSSVCAIAVDEKFADADFANIFGVNVIPLDRSHRDPRMPQEILAMTAAGNTGRVVVSNAHKHDVTLCVARRHPRPTQ